MNKKLLLVIAMCGMLSGIIFFNTQCINNEVVTHTVLANLDAKHLVEYSDLIIEGTIVSVSKEFRNEVNDNIIQKNITVEVNDIFKGGAQEDNKINIRIDGRNIGNNTYISDVTPTFLENEKVLLFLSQKEGNKYYRIVNSIQGIMHKANNVNNLQSSAEQIYCVVDSLEAEFTQTTIADLQKIINNEEVD